MFLVINKEKLYAYIVSIVTVVMLFGVASVVTPRNSSVETASNISAENKSLVNEDITNKNITNNNEVQTEK